MSYTETPVIGETPAMQFIIENKRYDTTNSTVAALSRGAMDDPSFQYPGAETVRFEDALYRTPKGAFFVHLHRTVKYPRGKPMVEDTAMAFTPEEAVGWIQHDGAMILDDTGLPLPDEA